MKSFLVQMPIAGVYTLVVEAETPEEAKDKFYDTVNNAINCMDSEEMRKIGADYEIDFYEKMSSGNVRHYNHSEIDISEI